VDGNTFGCLDSKPHAISTDLQDGDFDVIGEDNLLVLLAADNEHLTFLPLVISVSLALEKYRPAKNTRYFHIKRFKFFSLSGTLVPFFNMMKLFLSTTCLILLLFQPGHAQEISSRTDVPLPEANPRAPEHLTMVSETNYLNELALRGLHLETQGLLIESLDARTVYAELNSNVGFNPASIIKVATSFAALSKFGPEYHFETAFYSDGAINKKTHTLKGNLVLLSTGDPVLSSLDVSRLAREVLRAGIAYVTGDLIVTGPLTYGLFSTTDKATKGLVQALRRAGLTVRATVQGGAPRGTKIASHASSSLRDILFYQNAHSVNQTAERLGEAVGGPRAVEQFLIKDLGIPQKDVSISHTSGLDFNRITPRATVVLFRELIFWLNLKNMQPQDVLPVAGVDAGTLHRRFVGEEYRGGIIGKTGSLPSTDGGVSTLAGIAYTRDHGPVLFAIFNTNGSVATYRKLQDELMKGFIVESGGIPDVSASLHRLGN
jgi:D-alanyl-D-alanine carboxypeptidase/D-alanyl-D-alanine-endopeptidase (penicillin-binding protein 4)